MSVEFDEQNIVQRNNQYIGQIKKTPGMVKWLVKNGVVKSEQSAADLLLIGSIVILIFSVVLIMNANGAFEGGGEQNATIQELVDQGYKGPELIQELNRRNAK